MPLYSRKTLLLEVFSIWKVDFTGQDVTNQSVVTLPYAVHGEGVPDKGDHTLEEGVVMVVVVVEEEEEKENSDETFRKRNNNRNEKFLRTISSIILPPRWK
jgi:hypothetical protein